MKNYLMNNENKRNNELDFFDDAFGGFFKPLFYEEKHHSMKTDIKETENSYVLDIEVPGFDKKDVNVSLENGYLTVSAQKKTCEGDEHDEKDKKKENYIRRERSCHVSRSRRYRQRSRKSEIRKRRSYDRYPQREARSSRIA